MQRVSCKNYPPRRAAIDSVVKSVLTCMDDSISKPRQWTAGGCVVRIQKKREGKGVVEKTLFIP